MMFNNNKYKVIHRPPGYKPWLDERPIARPNVRAILTLLGLLLFACSSCTGVVVFAMSSGSSQPGEEELTTFPTVASLPSATATYTPTITPTLDPTITPTITLTPTVTPTGTATLTEGQATLTQVANEPVEVTRQVFIFATEIVPVEVTRIVEVQVTRITERVVYRDVVNRVVVTSPPVVNNIVVTSPPVVVTVSPVPSLPSVTPSYTPTVESLPSATATYTPSYTATYTPSFTATATTTELPELTPEVTP
jgi:hypothetical protein